MLRFLFPALLVLASCSTLKTVVSQPEPSPEEDMFRLYDSKSYVRYHITNDDDSLYIRLNTSEPASIFKILKTELSIYFDVEGKKSRKVYFRYPVKQETELDPNNAANPMQNKGMELEMLVRQLSDEAIFSVDKNDERFSILANDQDIRVSIEAFNNIEILYSLAIPFTKIATGGISSLNNLSIGIVSGKFNMPSNGGMQGGGQGGGMRGGGQGGGGRGGAGSNNMSAMLTPINIWFRIDLQKSK